MDSKRTAVYPGTFDPLTNGHMSIIQRGSRLFETVIVGVAVENSKQPLFTLEERVDMVRRACADNAAVRAEPFSGLLVDYARKRGAAAILRGLRAMSDFDYEFQMALMNRKLYPEIETVFLVTDFRWMYISSTIIKSVAMLGGDVATLVPAPVLPKLRKACGHPDTWPQASPPDPGEAGGENAGRA
jgi:pantetheine-phosphate adenylyltransferase